MTARRLAEIVKAGARWIVHPHDARARNLALLTLERPQGLFQPEPTTGADRYPGIFGYVRDRLGADASARLLSFGCSSGEEIFTLRRYFPRAQIKGIDINRRNIAAARRQLRRGGGDAGLVFETAASAAAEADGVYDAIFAMAVYRHADLGAAPESCAPLLRFVDFEASVFELARCLAPGGLLALRHANFRFCDTRAAAGFVRVFDAPPLDVAAPIYGPDNRLLRTTAGDDGVYEKRR